MKYDYSTMSRPLDGNAGPNVCTKQGGKIPPKKWQRNEESIEKYTMKELVLKVYQ